jgi:hypothetical protein
MFVGMFIGLVFLAALLLSLPGLFSPTVLGRRRRLPPPGADRTDSSRKRLRDRKDWRFMLKQIVVSPFALFLSLVVFPALAAITLVGTCATYRFYRHLAYRALRRQRHAFALPISFLIGFRLTFRRVRHQGWPR